MKTYHADASRGERYWLIHIPEINQWTQARNLGEVIPMARELIAVLLDMPTEAFDVEMALTLPAEVRKHLDRATEQRNTAARAQSEAANEYRAAARALKAQGITVRDIGKALNISHQRVQQLVS